MCVAVFGVEDVDDDPSNPDVAGGRSGGNIQWRRRVLSERRLHVDVNARTNGGSGYTALRLAEEHRGEDGECAALLRALGGVSLGSGDVVEDDE